MHFAGPGRSGDDDLAEARLRAALAPRRFDDVTFVLEPVAAACHYELGLDTTSSSSSPTSAAARATSPSSDSARTRDRRGGPPRSRQRRRRDRGDAFDAQMIRHVVSPALGRGTEYEATTGKALSAALALQPSRAVARSRC